MTSKKLALTTVLLFAFTAPALAQGAGGAGGGAASGAGAAAPAAPSGTVGTAGNSSSATGGTQDRSPEVKQSNTAKIVADEKAAAVEGSKTKPSAPGSGTVSAPGVGVGTAANGLPIGAPGSGLGPRKIPSVQNSGLGDRNAACCVSWVCQSRGSPPPFLFRSHAGASGIFD
jgi:hypothetical protein